MTSSARAPRGRRRPPDWSNVNACLRSYDAGVAPARTTEKDAVKAVLAALADAAPGHSVEVRVPPHAAIQVVAGPDHRRGTPPALVQMSARTLLMLAAGRVTWVDAVAEGVVRASGARCDLSEYLPLAVPGDV